MGVELRDGGAGEVIIVAAIRASIAEREAAMSDAESSSWLRSQCARGLDGRTLERVHALLHHGAAQRADRATLARRIERELACGRLLAVRRVRRRAIVTLTGEAYEPPIGPSEPVSWIELEVLDEEGNPLAEEPYEIITGDGRVRTGTLDAMGRTREDGIDPEDCKVRFPRLHEWKAA
jgi:hypothetical protein